MCRAECGLKIKEKKLNFIEKKNIGKFKIKGEILCVLVTNKKK